MEKAIESLAELQMNNIIVSVYLLSVIVSQTEGINRTHIHNTEKFVQVIFIHLPQPIIAKLILQLLYLVSINYTECTGVG